MNVHYEVAMARENRDARESTGDNYTQQVYATIEDGTRGGSRSGRRGGDCLVV